MRKILYIFILMVSSFFLFFLKEVNASTYNLTIPEDNFSYINDYFLELRKKTIDYCVENDKDYIITYDSSYIFDYYSHTTSVMSSHPYNRISTSQILVYKLVDGEFTQVSTKNSPLENYFFITTSEFTYRNFLDTNINKLNNTSAHIWNFKYQDLTYTVNQNDNFPTLYEIYIDIFGSLEPEQPEEPERNAILDLFYSLVIEKIQLFANYFIANSALIFILGIIILIFIAELIFRRLL